MSRYLCIANAPISLDNKIPTGFVIGGPNSSIYTGFVEAISHQSQTQQNTTTIRLASTQAPNLKAVLKHINRHAISQDPGTTDDELLEPSQPVPRSKFLWSDINNALQGPSSSQL